MDAGQSSVKLNDTDIPGAHLDEPFEAHNVAVLRWWLLCRGIKLTSCKNIRSCSEVKA